MRFAIALVFLVTLVNQSFAQSEQTILDYTSAYKLAQAGEKPMLVLVTATWCGPCQQMKATTLPELFKKGTFDKLHFAMVDYDAEPTVANALVGDRGVPQLVLFQKVNDQWVRSYVAGMQSAENVESFIAKASNIQVSNAKIADATTQKSTIDK